MENKTVSLTDEIYQQLADGLKTEQDYTHLRAKYDANKGPFYNALGRLFHDMWPKVQEFNEVQAKSDAAGLKLDQLDLQVKDAEGSLAPLEEKKNALNEQIEALETKLAEKSELLQHAAGVGKLGFDTERLRQLRAALTEIGAKNGLKGKEAVTKFFDDLKDYEAVLEAKALLHGLQTQIETRKLEAENWQAKEEALRRKHDDLKEAIGATDALLKRGVKAEEIVTWNGIVNKLGGAGHLQEELERYKTTSELLDGRAKEIKTGGKRVAELAAQVRSLQEQKLEITGAITSLSTAGTRRIDEMYHKVVAGLDSLFARGRERVDAASEMTVSELRTILSELRTETTRLAQLKAEAGKLEKELMYARFYVTDDETVLTSFPKEVIIFFLIRTARYCILKRINPLVTAPQGFDRKSTGLSSSAKVSLRDLLAWAEAGLAGVAE